MKFHWRFSTLHPGLMLEVIVKSCVKMIFTFIKTSVCATTFYFSLPPVLELGSSTEQIPDKCKCIFYHQHISLIVRLQWGNQAEAEF